MSAAFVNMTSAFSLCSCFYL